VRGGEADPGSGGAGGVQGDVGPGERQLHLVCAGACQLGAVQGCVEQGRVDAEAGFVAFGQGHLGVDRAVGGGPGGGHALEEGAVGDALFGQAVVEAVQVCLGGFLGWPRVEPSGRGGPRCEGAAGVLGPGSVGGAGVDGQGPVAVLVRCLDCDVQGDGVVGEREWGVQGQFPQCGAACLGSGVQGQVYPGGAGEQGGAQDGVVGQPGVGLQRHLAGQDQLL